MQGHRREKLRSGTTSHVAVGFTDLNGIMRTKLVNRGKVTKALDSSMGMSSAALGWDCADQNYANTSIPGHKNGWADVDMRLVPESARSYRGLPVEGSMIVLGELTDEHAAYCPRRVLSHQIEIGKEMGLAATAGVEFEFQLLSEDCKTLAGKPASALDAATRGPFCYSLHRLSGMHAYLSSLVDTCREMEIGSQVFHTELGPGMLEFALDPVDLMEAADNAILFKTAAKSVASNIGHTATFMAKPAMDNPGCGAHIHLSLRDLDGNPASYDANASNNLSEIFRNFLGGCQRLLPAITALFAPNINSYKRLVPGVWAPVDNSWGIENRTSSLRVIGKEASSFRFENRVPGADANPYLTLAATFGAGLYGVRNKIEPGPPRISASDALAHGERLLPRNLHEAIVEFETCTQMREIFGDEFVDYYAISLRWEIDQFNNFVSDWEIGRYLEAI